MAAEQRRDQAEDAATARAAAGGARGGGRQIGGRLVWLADKWLSKAPRPWLRLRRKVGPAHRKTPAVLAAVPHAPLVIADADPPANDAAAATVAPGEAREPDLLLDNPLVAKTLDIKDHVVAATRHVVSVIGDMFASVGGSISGAVSGSRQFNSAS